MNPLKELKSDPREVFGSVISLVGAKRFVSEIEGSLKEMFEKINVFYCPDDVGEFPDTQGYTDKDWKNFESDLEDPALFPWMQKAVDSVMDFNSKRLDTLSKLGYSDIESFLHSPRFGGQVWACVGMVRAFKAGYIDNTKIILANK